jgi:hypothetical protein
LQLDLEFVSQYFYAKTHDGTAVNAVQFGSPAVALPKGFHDLIPCFNRRTSNSASFQRILLSIRQLTRFFGRSLAKMDSRTIQDQDASEHASTPNLDYLVTALSQPSEPVPQAEQGYLPSAMQVQFPARLDFNPPQYERPATASAKRAFGSPALRVDSSTGLPKSRVVLRKCYMSHYTDST